jgi:hypothetical protein
MEGLNIWFSESPSTRALSVTELDNLVRGLIGTTPTHIIAKKETVNEIRRHLKRHFGFKVKGCKGERLIRMRKGRWEVIDVRHHHR